MANDIDNIQRTRGVGGDYYIRDDRGAVPIISWLSAKIPDSLVYQNDVTHRCWCQKYYYAIFTSVLPTHNLLASH